MKGAENMYQILDFIDSKSIRDFNKNTKFSPSEQAILISKSEKRTIEEKISALAEIIHTYSEKEFQFEYQDDRIINFKKIIINTIRSWEAVLKGRKDSSEGYIYAVYLAEKDFNDSMHDDRLYFTSYEGAFEYLKKEKQHYLDDEDLRDCITMGMIQRIKLNKTDWNYIDNFYFDNDLRLVTLIPGFHSTAIYRGGRLCDPYPWCDYAMFIPVPFKAGDIVKVESPFYKTAYGVFPYEWKRPERKDWYSFEMSLDMYDNTSKTFWSTDDTNILEIEYCPDEELPEDEKILKGIREIRKGKMDFFVLLEHYKDLDRFDNIFFKK